MMEVQQDLNRQFRELAVDFKVYRGYHGYKVRGSMAVNGISELIKVYTPTLHGNLMQFETPGNAEFQPFLYSGELFLTPYVLFEPGDNGPAEINIKLKDYFSDGSTREQIVFVRSGVTATTTYDMIAFPRRTSFTHIEVYSSGFDDVNSTFHVAMSFDGHQILI